jgi:uncharacterized protein YdeI (BOF family)
MKRTILVTALALVLGISLAFAGGGQSRQAAGTSQGPTKITGFMQ